VQQTFFDGPSSVRYPKERLAFWVTLLVVLPAALGVGFLLHQSVGLSEAALLIVGTMIYVTLARGRLLGSSVRIHQAQHPEVFAIVKRACAALNLPLPMIFVREDLFVPVVALGFGEPYSLVISSNWIEHLSEDELSFLIGRQLGHISAGHTRFLSLLSVNGNENPIVALLFGVWLRRCDLTCDRIGLLVCGSLDAATRAIAVATFHTFGRTIDLATFAEQAAELKSDPVLRWGEWLGAEPYATVRIESMRIFLSTQAYKNAEEWFLREVNEEPPALPEPGSARVVKTDCAGWWRRLAAFAIDATIVVSMISTFGTHSPVIIYSPDSKAPVAAKSSTTKGLRTNWTNPFFDSTQATPDSADASTDPLESVRDSILGLFSRVKFQVYLSIYLAILVGLSGQSLGMMIAGLRVVTVDFRRPGLLRTLWRYAIVAVLLPFIMIGSFFSRRVLLQDWASKTRVIKVERVLVRTGPA
jgi:Zn-dependent protease with chaperone function